MRRHWNKSLAVTLAAALAVGSPMTTLASAQAAMTEEQEPVTTETPGALDDDNNLSAPLVTPAETPDEEEPITGGAEDGGTDASPDVLDPAPGVSDTTPDASKEEGKDDTTSDLPADDKDQEGSGDFIVNPEAKAGTDYTFTEAEKALVILTNKVTKITQKKASSDQAIVVKGAAAITLENLNLKPADRAALTIDAAAGAVTLQLAGSNTLTGAKDFAAVQKENTAGLTIQGSGSLYAAGGVNAAGIGGAANKGVSEITVLGGHITAAGGTGAAGIGAGTGGEAKAIYIGGGYVKASAGEGASAIGSGKGKTTAEGVPSNKKDGQPVYATELGGLEKGKAYTLTVSNAADFRSEGVTADDNGKVYVYLPAGETTVTAKNGTAQPVTYKGTISKDQPVNVLTKEEVQVQQISQIQVNVDEKKLGEKAELPKDANYTADKVEWSKEQEGDFRLDTAVVKVTAKEGYAFSDKVTAAMNKGSAAVNVSADKKSAEVSYTFRTNTHTPVIANPNDDDQGNLLWGLNEGVTYKTENPTRSITIWAVGAGIYPDSPQETEPGEGDVRYLPAAWKLAGQTGSFNEDSKVYMSDTEEISLGSAKEDEIKYIGFKAGPVRIPASVTRTSQTLIVTYERQVYDSVAEEWVSDGEEEQESVSFYVQKVSSATPTKKPGKSTTTTTKKKAATTTKKAAQKTSTASKSKNAKTGDESPIVPLVLVMAAAGGCGAVVINRKKKKQEK